MYSVVLTELGISVFKEEQLDRAFAFDDPVRDYLEIKNKHAKLGRLVDYLSPFERGFEINDGSLQYILKRNSIDSKLMDSKHLEKIQESKPEIIVQSGFAENIQDALGRLREFALDISSSKVTQASESPDLHIIQSINMLDEVDKIANSLSSRLREWYGLHFPELDNVVDSINGYAQIVLGGKTGTLDAKIFEDAGFPESKVEILSLVSQKSKGGDISDENLAIVQNIARQVLYFNELRGQLEEHLEAEMSRIAPNLTTILGPAVGARMLGRAGSLGRLAKLPASTIQILGAEKALFRSLKTGSQPPKHGLLFQHALVHAAPRWQRGKIARAVAAKAVIAARIDMYGEGLNQTLLEKLNVRVGEINTRYENPPEPKPANNFGNTKPRGKKGKKRRFGRR